MIMKSTCCTILLILLLAVSAFASDSTNYYVSLKGNFYFSYPPDWEQLDYLLLDVFLEQRGAGDLLFDYEAGFYKEGSVPFYRGPYFILTVDSSDAFTQHEIDSTLNTLRQSFGEGIKYYPVADFMANLESNTPVYDSERKLATVMSEISDGVEVTKKHLLMMKFFEQGLASFYFYSPDSLFAVSKDIMNQVIETFTYGNVDNVLPTEEVEVADINEALREEARNGSVTTWIIPAVAVFLIVVYVIYRYRKKPTHRNT